MPTIPKPSRRGYLPPCVEREVQGRRTSPNSEFYHSTSWRRMRKWKLQANPLCEMCAARGGIVAATMVDHIIPINQGGLPLDECNLQSLCARCHNRKSGREACRKKL